MHESIPHQGVENRIDFKVRWGDVDAVGIVYYVKYFDWFSDGRVALLDDIGLPYYTYFHNKGVNLVAIEANCRYRKSLLPEDRVTLATSMTGLSRAKMIFNYRLQRQPGGEKVAEGWTEHAYVDNDGKPFDLRKRFPDLWALLCMKAGPERLL